MSKALERIYRRLRDVNQSFEAHLAAMLNVYETAGDLPSGEAKDRLQEYLKKDGRRLLSTIFGYLFDDSHRTMNSSGSVYGGTWHNTKYTTVSSSVDVSDKQETGESPEFPRDNERSLKDSPRGLTYPEVQIILGYKQPSNVYKLVERFPELGRTGEDGARLIDSDALGKHIAKPSLGCPSGTVVRYNRVLIEYWGFSSVDDAIKHYSTASSATTSADNPTDTNIKPKKSPRRKSNSDLGAVKEGITEIPANLRDNPQDLSYEQVQEMMGYESVGMVVRWTEMSDALDPEKRGCVDSDVLLGKLTEITPRPENILSRNERIARVYYGFASLEEAQRHYHPNGIGSETKSEKEEKREIAESLMIERKAGIESLSRIDGKLTPERLSCIFERRIDFQAYKEVCNVLGMDEPTYIDLLNNLIKAGGKSVRAKQEQAERVRKIMNSLGETVGRISIDELYCRAGEYLKRNYHEPLVDKVTIPSKMGHEENSGRKQSKPPTNITDNSYIPVNVENALKAAQSYLVKKMTINEVDAIFGSLGIPRILDEYFRLFSVEQEIHKEQLNDEDVSRKISEIIGNKDQIIRRVYRVRDIAKRASESFAPTFIKFMSNLFVEAFNRSKKYSSQRSLSA